MKSCTPVARDWPHNCGRRACGRSFRAVQLLSCSGWAAPGGKYAKTVAKRQTIRMREYPSRIRRLAPLIHIGRIPAEVTRLVNSAFHTRSYRDRRAAGTVPTASRCIQPTSSIRATGNRPRGHCNRPSVWWALNTRYRLRRSSWRNDSSSTLLPWGQGGRAAPVGDGVRGMPA
jgi:hypothetical protein